MDVITFGLWKKQMRIVLDCETNLAHDKIHLVVTKDIDTGELITWRNPTGLNDYLSKATQLIAHNGIGFDFRVLNNCWKTRIGLKNVFDTLIVSRLLDPSRETGHSLEAWGNTLGFHKIDYSAVWQWMMDRKEAYAGESFDSPIDSLLEHYCIRDVEVTAKLYHRLISDVAEKQFSQESIDLEHQVAAIIAQQERNGFKLDQIFATCLLTDIKSKVAGIYERMQERWPPVTIERFSDKTGKRLKDSVVTFNPGSRQQIGERLKELGWKPKEFTDNGQPKVDETILANIKIPEAQVIAEYLMLNKRISQIESWMDAVGKDGRVHGRVITNGAVTGRCTHSSPNLAQIPNTSSVYGKECRECWTVEKDRVLIGCDLSGIELRCLSHYMQDADWQHELLEGDVHWKNTQAFGLVPMGTVKKDKQEHKDARNLSKTLTYSVLYGAGAAKVGSTVGGSSKQGAKLIDNFMNNTPALKKLKAKVDKLAAKGYVPGLDGRKVWVRSEHAALNSLLQSAGAIIAKQWIICLTHNLKAAKIDYKLLAFVHDEVCIEGYEEDAQQIVDIVVASAKEAGDKLNFRCPVGAEGHIGRTWADVH
jgi:DNA polymerase I-like protein with 3'-5' exonuclease and polymerase domains